MHSCISTDFILLEIISKLNLCEKFGVQGVCRQWKNIAIECLKHHEYLVISEISTRNFWYIGGCYEHLVENDNLICGKYIHLEFWQRTLPLLQTVKYVYMEVTTDDVDNSLFPIYKAMLQLIIDSCGQSLECLCIPGHYDYDDETFPLTDSLPRLKHMLLNHTTSQVTKNILTACPNLEYLESSTSFTEWKITPKVLKILVSRSEDLDGMNNLLCSPAAQSLEIINTILMASEICYQSYHLSSLKRFGVIIAFEVTNCLTHLARILSFAPVLRELIITITASDEIEPQVWIKVLSECQTVTHLEVDLYELFRTENHLINVSSWQYYFAETIVLKMKKLESLEINFSLPSDGLRLLSQHENLECFRHKIHTENLSYDTDALVYFLTLSLDKKLRKYHIPIQYGEYVILQESFYDFIYKIETKHFLRLHMSQIDKHYPKESIPPDKIPGMIYVTELGLDEWDLICPCLENIEIDD